MKKQVSGTWLLEIAKDLCASALRPFSFLEFSIKPALQEVGLKSIGELDPKSEVYGLETKQELKQEKVGRN